MLRLIRKYVYQWLSKKEWYSPNSNIVIWNLVDSHIRCLFFLTLSISGFCPLRIHSFSNLNIFSHSWDIDAHQYFHSDWERAKFLTIEHHLTYGKGDLRDRSYMTSHLKGGEVRLSYYWQGWQEKGKTYQNMCWQFTCLLKQRKFEPWMEPFIY